MLSDLELRVLLAQLDGEAHIILTLGEGARTSMPGKAPAGAREALHLWCSEQFIAVVKAHEVYGRVLNHVAFYFQNGEVHTEVAYVNTTPLLRFK